MWTRHFFIINLKFDMSLDSMGNIYFHFQIVSMSEKSDSLCLIQMPPHSNLHLLFLASFWWTPKKYKIIIRQDYYPTFYVCFHLFFHNVVGVAIWKVYHGRKKTVLRRLSFLVFASADVLFTNHISVNLRQIQSEKIEEIRVILIL